MSLWQREQRVSFAFGVLIFGVSILLFLASTFSSNTEGIFFTLVDVSEILASVLGRIIIVSLVILGLVVEVNYSEGS